MMMVPEEGQPVVETTGTVVTALLIFAERVVIQVAFVNDTVPVASARYVYEMVPWLPAARFRGLGL
jgi:hypothetical protein